MAIFGFPIMMIIVIVWLSSHERIKLYQLQADLYAKALEKGESVSADWFVKPDTKKNTSLKAGIICMASGVGIVLAVWVLLIFIESTVQDNAIIVFKLIGAIGIIPFVIGIAFLIIHFAEKKKETIREGLKNAQ